MKSYIRVCIIAVLALIASAAFAEPVTLEYKFAPGDVDKYKMTMDIHFQMPAILSQMSLPSMDMSMTMTYVQKTLSVNPDGSAKMEVTYGAPTISGVPAAKSADAAKLAGQTITMTMSKRGQLISAEGFDKMLAGSAMKNMDFSNFFSSASNQALFPEGPIEVGSSWTQNVPVPFGGSQMSVTSTLESADQLVWNQKAAKVRQTFNGIIDMSQVMKAVAEGMSSAPGGKDAKMPDLSGMMGNMNIDGNMTFLFAPAIGKLLKGDGTTQMKMTINMPPEAVQQGAPSTMDFGANMTMSITRFK